MHGVQKKVAVDLILSSDFDYSIYRCNAKSLDHFLRDTAVAMHKLFKKKKKKKKKGQNSDFKVRILRLKSEF